MTDKTDPISILYLEFFFNGKKVTATLKNLKNINISSENKICKKG